MAHKIGSMFDGSGGFPLAGSLCGLKPTWASEVEPYPIAVTRTRFPNMKHLGDVSKIDGGAVEPVDVITFGSPCQDLSVAGKQAGIKHTTNGDEETTRSGLFMEAVRVIKEMRRKTNGLYPSFALWENVPGAFSSNKGEDFRIVLEELIKIVEPCATLPAVPAKGWPYADSYVGNGWSLAYRVFDAQYWGVPQRRRRIHLVLDLRGQRARSVLFEREGVRGYFTTCGTPWQGTPADAQGSTATDDRPVGYDHYNGAITGEISGTLGVNAGVSTGRNGVIERRGRGLDELSTNTFAESKVFENHSQDTRYTGPLEVAQTVSATYGMGGNNQPFVVEPFCKSARPRFKGDAPTYIPVYCLQGNGIDRADTAGCNGKGWRENECYTLNTIDRPAVVYAMDRASYNQGENAKYDLEVSDGGVNYTLLARGPSAVAYSIDQDDKKEPGDATEEKGTYTASRASFFTRGAYELADCLVATDYKDPPIINAKEGAQYTVRRLTPTECARLQGFPDRWGDIEEKKTFTKDEYRFWLEARNTHAAINGKTVKDYTEKQMLTWYNRLHTDSAEYKMWGNGIALPPALYVMQGIVDALTNEEDDTWLY